MSKIDEAALLLRTGKELQLVIAAAEDLQQHLAPLRTLRARHKAKLAAGVGVATSAVVGGAMWVANLGFWASLGAALGLATVPLVASVAGLGGLALGLPRRRAGDPQDYVEQCERVALTLACFQSMADADGRVSAEERLLLQAAALQFPLAEDDRRRIEEADIDETIEAGAGLDEQIRREILRGTWLLAETDGVTEEERVRFGELTRRLGLEGSERLLRQESRELQGAINELVTAMFRTCQQVLAPSLGQGAASAFLEALSEIAATPRVRRALRNSQTSGFSAGGVTRTLDQHGQWPKLVAQAQNAIRAVYGAPSERREAQRRLDDLIDATSIAKGQARAIRADLDQLFDSVLGEAHAEPGDA